MDFINLEICRIHSDPRLWYIRIVNYRLEDLFINKSWSAIILFMETVYCWILFLLDSIDCRFVSNSWYSILVIQANFVSTAEWTRLYLWESYRCLVNDRKSFPSTSRRFPLLLLAPVWAYISVIVVNKSRKQIMRNTPPLHVPVPLHFTSSLSLSHSLSLRKQVV